jgi:hypothetical protein
MSNNEYDVGYKKPPKSGQFQKGVSGNPQGRSKGTKNLKTDLQEELSSTINVVEGGTHITLTKQRALIKALSTKALKGDVRAMSTLIKMIERLLNDEAEDIENNKPLSSSDQALINSFLARKGLS